MAKRSAMFAPASWIFGIPLATGLVEAIRRVWVCDDIFISLRYIQNLFQGNGLVFNAGERVEGYTHFLWVMILASLHRFGLDLVWLAQYLSIAAFIALLVTLWWRSSQRAAPGWFGLPIAAAALALHKDMQIYATGGLETMPFALALLWAVLVTAGAKPRWGLAATLYAIATLLRPEGAMYTTAAFFYVWWCSRSGKEALRFAGTWLLLVLPSEVFRVVYFGDFLPNTFYAKSGQAANWQQGWHYTSLYFSIYAVLLLMLVAVVWLVVRGVLHRRRGIQNPGTDIRGGASLATLAAIHVMLCVLYVTRLGGDFMFARFFIPITPLLVLVIEETVVLTRKRFVEVTAFAVLLAGILYARIPHGEIFAGRARAHGIVNEYNFYPPDYLATLQRQGEILGRALQGTGARVGLLSGQDAMAYFGNLSYALEPHGLTDRQLARKPITERGRPGHERTASLEDLLLRSVHFRMRYGFTVGLAMQQQIRFDDLYGEIIFYDRTLMQQLRGRPGVNFLDFPEFLRGTFANFEGSDGQLVEDYRRNQLFYFIHNEDSQLLAQYRAALLAYGIPAVALDDVDRMAGDFRRVMLDSSLRP